MATPTATLVETRGLRPFKSSEEYLYAMKEDLAEWLNNLYAELHMNVANFMDRLDTGVTLCRHANNVRRYAEEHMAKRQAQGKDVHSIAISVLNLPPVKHLPGAKPGTFFARDNVSNFIGWSRRGLGVFECLLFETDDLIMRKNEKHVILCLLEVARRGAKLGMPAPMLIQLEREIDREIAADKKKLGFSDNEYYDADLEDDLSDSDDEAQYGPLPQIVTNDLKSLDEMVRDLVARCTCPTQFPMIRVSEGKYRIGDTKVLIFVRVLRSHVMVRVGGGWDTLSHYLDKHDPCRCKTSHRAAASAKLVGVRSGGPAIDINQAQVHYERSPPRTRRSSASSTGSGGGTTAPPNPSLLTPSHTAARANRNRSRSPTPRLDTLSPRVDNRRSRSPTPRRNVSRSTTPDPKGRGKLDRSRSISKNREYEYRGRSASKNRDSDTSRARSVSKNRDTEASRARSVSKNRDTDYRGRSASKTRGKEGDERKFSRSDSIHSYSGLLGDDRGRSCSNDYGNSRNGSLDCTSRNGSLDYASMRNGSLDYASPRNGSLDYASTRNGSLDYALGSRNSSLDYGNTRTGHLNHTDSTESYSLPYDINLGKLRSDSCISDSLDVSKINEEISKLNRTYNIDESSFLKRTNTNEYQSGIDSTPAPRVSDNFSRTYEQVNITRPVTPIQAKSRIDSGVDTTPSMRISDNFVSSASNDSSDEGYRSLGALHNKPVNTSAPVRSVSSLSSVSSKPHRSRSTGAASPSPQSSPFRRNLSSQRSGSARVNGWNKPSPAVTTETKSNTWNSRSNGVKKRPTLEETTFVEQVADIMQQYASMIPSPRKDKLSSSSSGISSTRIPAPIHQRT